MKSRKSFLKPCVSGLTVLMLVATCFVGGCLAPGGIMFAPEAKDVVDAWTATEGDWAFYRVVLYQDGTGLIGVTQNDDSPMLYRIASWRLSDKKRIEMGEPDCLRELPIRITPIGNSKPLQVTGWAGQTHMRLHFSWDGWSPRWVHLYRERQLEERAARTRDAMNKVR